MTNHETVASAVADNPYASLHRLSQQAFFAGRTRTFGQRSDALKALYQGIRKHEQALMDALAADLGKSPFEAYSNEIGFVLAEISHLLSHLKKWMKPQRVIPDVHLLPGSARILREPYGVSLVIAPWNYPVQLLLSPLAGALAGGNTVICKPSEVSTASAAALAALLEDTFDPALVTVVNGGPEVSGHLLDLPVDHIFFTGSVPVGRLVMAAAAKRLTPVTLELGGKSPVVVTASADIEITARRIAWGKFNNAGQTCVAPDYVLAHRSVYEPLLAALSSVIGEFYGPDPSESTHYGRIINSRHFERLTDLMQAGHGLLRHGGASCPETRYIEPSLYGPVPDDHPLMADEIFGPLLPVLIYDDQEEAITRILARPKPLALYVFSRDKNETEGFVTRIPFGGGAINATVLHVASCKLPFGGVGPSGFGQYHGKASFETFTHPKTLYTQPLHPDFGLAYPNRTLDLRWVRRLLK